MVWENVLDERHPYRRVPHSADVIRFLRTVGARAYLVHEFVDAVNRQRLPRINVWEAVRYCAPGFVAHQSALKGGELLKIPDWGDPIC